MNTPHTHRCGCGAAWLCQRPDCRLDDACGTCEIEQFEQWADAHAPLPKDED